MVKGLVSIVITYYNYEKYVVSCLDSVFNQTYKDIEVVVVNDASPDKGYITIHETHWKHRAKNIGMILKAHRINRGIAASKNTGIKHCKGEFIAFIDADDMLTPDSIKARVNAFKKKPETEFVHGFAYSIEGNLTYEECLGSKFRMHGRKNRVNAQTTMYRKEVFEKYGMFYPIHSKEDKEMTYRLGIHPLSPLPKLVQNWLRVKR